MSKSWYSDKAPISDIYVRILKNGYKIWMSKLNDFPEINIGENMYIVSMEGTNVSGHYEAKRIRLSPND